MSENENMINSYAPESKWPRAVLNAHAVHQLQNPELEAILGQLLQPDNATIQTAQGQLKQFMKRPDSLPALVNVLMSSQDEGVRQMSATMLRQRITKSWMRVGVEVKAVVKQSLITSVTNDPSYVDPLFRASVYLFDGSCVSRFRICRVTRTHAWGNVAQACGLYVLHEVCGWRDTRAHVPSLSHTYVKRPPI